MKTAEVLFKEIAMKVRGKIENIGVVIPESSGPVSEVVSGKGRVLPHPARKETLAVLGSGRQRALIGYALLHPEALIGQINFPDPKAVEAAFHQQLAQLCPPDGYQDYLTPLAEKQLGVIEFQQDDSRIKNLEKTYKLEPGSIRPRILTDEKGDPVSVWDWVRPDEKIAGAPEFPPKAEWRTVEVPDIAGVMAAKGTQQLIDRLGLVDRSKPESIFSRQAAVKNAVIQFAAKGEIGVSPDLLEITVAAFMFSAEHPEIAGSDTVSRMIQNRDDLAQRRAKRDAARK